MPKPEQEPTAQKPTGKPRPSRELPLAGLPAQVADEKNLVTLARNDAGSLVIRVHAGETPLFAAAITPEQDVHIIFSRPKNQPPHHEERRELLPVNGETNEPQPVTIEGYPVRPGKYVNDEQTGKRSYELTIAHHPNLQNRKQSVYYTLVAEGDKADACFAAYITDTRTPVHVTGDDLSKTVKKKDGTDRIDRKIRVDSLEKIRGRSDSPQVLRAKVRLSTDQKELLSDGEKPSM